MLIDHEKKDKIVLLSKKDRFKNSLTTAMFP